MTSAADENQFDVVVVGGGLLGAGIARDAAQRGLSVALFEQEDFGSGAVSKSSRMVLGGLSALGTLDFTRVREDIREREILQHTAPHLVKPQTCLLPFYSHGLLAQARLRAGLALSDALGFDHALRVHQLLSIKEARKRAPDLRPDGLLGAALVWEAAVPQIERLAWELAADARRHGAILFSHTRVGELCRMPRRQGRERIEGVRWKDCLTGKTGETHAALVIVAAGREQPRLCEERQAGTHFVKTVSLVGPPLPGLGDALVLPHEDLQSLLLAVPQGDGCWIGSLDLDTEGDLGAVYATGMEVATLVEAARVTLPGLELSQIRRADAVVHALTIPGQENEDPAANGGRIDGLLSVSGAGITRFRQVAEDAVDIACRKLGRALSAPPCRTASTSLPCPASVSSGTEEKSTVEQQVERAVAEDGCRTLRGFLERRAPQLGSAAERKSQMPAVLKALADTLGWDRERQAAEVKAWKAETALGQAFRVL